MKHLVTIALALSGSAITPAWASVACFVPMRDWQPRAAVAEMAGDRGWTVYRIKIDDGCYEVYASDADGSRFEAIVNPATLEVLAIHLREPRHGD